MHHRSHHHVAPLLTIVLALICLCKLSRAGELFDRLDRNADGRLTTSDVEPDRRFLVERLLRTSDANHDGSLDEMEFDAGTRSTRPDLQSVLTPLSRDEASSMRKARDAMETASRTFVQLDRNRDGKLQLSEVPEDRRPNMQKALRRLGTDGLTRQQFLRLRQIRDQGQVPGRRPSDGKSDSADRAVDRQQPSMDRLLQLDRDNDGRLTEDEVPERMQRFFSRLDRDGNGFLDRQELRSAVDRLKRRRKPSE